MKTLINIGNGALVATWNAGALTLTLNKSESLGGGAAAGVVTADGQGSIVLEGKQAFDLGMALLEAHSPAALVPLEKGAQAMGDAAIASS